MTLENAVRFRTTCFQNGLDVSDSQISQLEEFASLLLEWNKKINLISRRDEANVWLAHLLHSASILFKVDIGQGAVVLDLGTGGGLPGLPLKILRPDIAITLLDSTLKKINVVKEIASHLGLNTVDVIWARAEDLGKRKQYSHKFDLVVARAVAPLNDLLRWSAPFLRSSVETKFIDGDNKRGGKKYTIARPSLVTLKGGDLEGEIRQTKQIPHVEKITVIDLTLSGSTQLGDEEKKIVVAEFGPGSQQKAG